MQEIEKFDAMRPFGMDYLTCDKNEITIGRSSGTISKRKQKKNQILASEKPDSNSWQKYEL